MTQNKKDQQKESKNLNTNPYLKVKDQGEMKGVVMIDYIIMKLQDMLQSPAMSFQEKGNPYLILGNRLDEFANEIIEVSQKMKEKPKE